MTGSILKIRLFGDPSLRKKSLPVAQVSSSEQLLIKSMLATMYQHKGVGLAAPQVGIHQRIFVADIGEGPWVFVNPVIVRRSGKTVREEGCLSIPEVTVLVPRAKAIKVRYTDEHNQETEKAFDDLMARVIQHETDHLNGKLIIDYAGFWKKRRLKEKLQTVEQQSKGGK